MSSSAATFEYDPAGRQGIGVNQPQSGLDYPFVRPSEDVRYLIADLYLAYEEPSDYSNVAEHPLPLSIGWIYGLGDEPADKPLWAPDPTHDVDLVIRDADDEVVFDSTEAEYFTTTDWGNYRIYEWRTETGVLRVVVYIAWQPTDGPEPRDYPTHLEPERGVLDARATYRMPKRVKSLRLVLDQFTKTAVDFKGGYNIRLTRETPTAGPGERNIEQITIDATPGAGDGLFPGCTEQDIVLRRINGVGPSTPGDFLLAGVGCYWVRQPTSVVDEFPFVVRPTLDTDPMSGHLQIGNDCGPCCSCDDYVESGKYLNRIWMEGVAVGQRAESTRNQYHENRDRWQEAKICLEKRPLRLALQAQACPYLDVVAQYCNQTDKCLKDIMLIIRFSTTPEIEPSCACEEEDDPECGDPVPESAAANENVTVVCGYTTRSGPDGTEKYTLDGKWCEYRAYFDAIDPSSSVFVRFRLQFPDSGQAVAEGGTAPQAYAVSACLRAVVGGRWLCIPSDAPVSVAVDRQSAVLECPANSGGAGC